MKNPDSSSTNFENIEVFKGKTLANIFKEIHNNHKDKDKQITELIDSLKPLITNITDAIQLVPLLKDYLDIGIKNNEQLVKLATVIQRAVSVNKSENGSGDDDMTIPKEEREELLKNAKIVNKNNDQITSMMKSVNEIVDLTKKEKTKVE
jgi:hypothetical protein